MHNKIEEMEWNRWTIIMQAHSSPNGDLGNRSGFEGGEGSKFVINYGTWGGADDLQFFAVHTQHGCRLGL